jgi:membrane protein YqaA with SNARE-associated domain
MTSIDPATVSVYSNPVLVASHFLQYTQQQLFDLAERVLTRGRIALSLLLSAGFVVATFIPGPQQQIIHALQKEATWSIYWLLLGVASSIGLGTGLHTFVLFLGPHIAQVTMFAYSCGHLEFAEHGADSFQCHPMENTTPVTIWNLFYKVQWECFCWGFGTALGELPPYFMARAAALSGRAIDELQEIEALRKESGAQLSLKDRLVLSVHDFVKRMGFVGILLFASIPNPLFDLAGIICGHFLIPFSTFFGATMIGKALIKSSIQAIFVIGMFSKDMTDTVLSVLHSYAPQLSKVLEQKLADQIATLTGNKSLDPQSQNFVAILWNGLIIMMMVYFALSIVDSLGVHHYNETTKKDKKE